jgi:hypothetical protein
MAQRTTLITYSVPTNEVGVASSVLALVRNIAGAFGIAVFATILNNSIENHLLSLSQNTIINTLTPQIYSSTVGLIILKAQVLAYITVFKIAALIIFIGAIAAIFIKTSEEEKKFSRNPNTSIK